MNNSYRMIEGATVLGATANAIAVTFVNVQPFNAANVHYEVRIMESSQMPGPDGTQSTMMFPARTLFTSSLTLTGNDYAAWADDDNYLYEKIAELHGLTLIPLPEPGE